MECEEIRYAMNYRMLESHLQQSVRVLYRLPLLTYSQKMTFLSHGSNSDRQDTVWRLDQLMTDICLDSTHFLQSTIHDGEPLLTRGLHRSYSILPLAVQMQKNEFKSGSRTVAPGITIGFYVSYRKVSWKCIDHVPVNSRQFIAQSVALINQNFQIQSQIRFQFDANAQHIHIEFVQCGNFSVSGFLNISPGGHSGFGVNLIKTTEGRRISLVSNRNG